MYKRPYGRNLCSAGNPTLEPNITSISKQVAKLWPIYILKMAVGRHLGFYRTGNSAIRSADAENSWARTKYGVDRAPFARYSALNYTVTLKLKFGVTRGHRKRHYSIEHIRIYIRLPQQICLYLLPFPRYSRILVENCYPPNCTRSSR